MHIYIGDTAAALSSHVADQILKVMRSSPAPLICTASGDSPAGTYRALVATAAEGSIDLSHWNYVGLDEWVGMNGTDEGSCRYHLDRQLFGPLQVDDHRICFFDGRLPDLPAECARIENFIRKNQGLDLIIAGVGLNGHVGMNEPGSDVSLHAHVAELAPMTKEVGQKYFNSARELTQGVTLGMADFMETPVIFLIINGKHKAAIVKEVVEGPITGEVPASLLRNHPGLYVFLDREAASLLEK